MGLRVTPGVNTAVHGESNSKVFYCRNDDNTFASGITWIDPNSNSYTPGTTGLNGRVVAEASYLTVNNIVNSDAGMYICQRNTGSLESDHGTLIVYGKTLYNVLQLI